MKKTKLTLISLGILLLPVVVLAQLSTGTTGGLGGPTTIQALVNDIENVFGVVFGAIAVVMFVIAGVLFLTAGGDPEKVGAARSAFIWGVAGVVVGILAYTIVAIVSSFVK